MDARKEGDLQMMGDLLTGQMISNRENEECVYRVSAVDGLETLPPSLPIPTVTGVDIQDSGTNSEPLIHPFTIQLQYHTPSFMNM